MIESKEEYYNLLERLRAMNIENKLSKHLQSKLEAFEEVEKLVNLTIPNVVGRSEQLCGNLDKNYNCKNMCLTHCIDGNKFWK